MLRRLFLERLTGRAAKVKVTAGTSVIQKASGSLSATFTFTVLNNCNQTMSPKTELFHLLMEYNSHLLRDMI